MTFDDLATLFRLAVDDCDATDPLWTDLELANYMDGAQKEFARRTDYFSDASTVAVTQIAYTAGETLIALDPRVTKVRSAKLIIGKSKLEPVKYADMEARISNPSDYHSPAEYDSQLDWEDSTGTPRYLVMDIETDKVRLSPIPVIDDTVKMMVYRLPINDLSEDYQELEVVEDDYQRGLLFYMKYMAYGKNDIDTYDERLQITALSNHEDFIEKAKGQLRRKRFSATKGVVRYGGL